MTKPKTKKTRANPNCVEAQAAETIRAANRKLGQRQSAAKAMRARRARRKQVGLLTTETPSTPAMSALAKELDFLIKSIFEAYEHETMDKPQLRDPTFCKAAINHILKHLGLDAFAIQTTETIQEKLAPNQVRVMVQKNLVEYAKKSPNSHA